MKMPLFIYADRIEHNIKVIKEKTKKFIMAVVKSNAYEMKTSFMIPLLRKNGVTFFAFEKKKEYLEAKQYLTPTDQILIMESVSDLSGIDLENVRLTINSPLDALFLKDIQEKVLVHIRVNTGMNRLGLNSLEELKWVLKLLKGNEKKIEAKEDEHYEHQN